MNSRELMNFYFFYLLSDSFINLSSLSYLSTFSAALILANVDDKANTETLRGRGVDWWDSIVVGGIAVSLSVGQPRCCLWDSVDGVVGG